MGTASAGTDFTTMSGMSVCLRLLGCQQLEEFNGRTGLWCGAIQHLVTFGNSLGASATTESVLSHRVRPAKAEERRVVY
jgi:hypothetical protein